MGREIVNLPGGGVGIIPKEKNKTSFHKQMIDEINDIAEKKRIERIEKEKKKLASKRKLFKVIVYALGILAAVITYYIIRNS